MTDVEDVLRSGMRLMSTTWGHVGMAHPLARKGDYVCILKGTSTPVILQPVQDSELPAEVVASRRNMIQEHEEDRYIQGMKFKMQFTGGFQVVGEAYVRMKDTSEAVKKQVPFCNFYIH